LLKTDKKAFMNAEQNHSGAKKHRPGTGRAEAFANLALVKYFGKRDVALNLPAAPSLSVSLDPLITKTAVCFDPQLSEDVVYLNNERAKPAFEARISRFLDLMRQKAGATMRARVDTINHFPTAAGLASSASGFAALTLAAADALGLCLCEQELSATARRGSGSAARSVPGGVALWQAGEKPDGSDSFAYRIAEPGDLDLRVAAGVSDPGPKSIGSTEAMEHTRYTSPYYENWIETVQRHMKAATEAVKNKDLEQLGEIAEHSALAMHAAALAAAPGILFWNGATAEGLHLVRRLRKKGLFAYFTCDAGPQPKVLCTSADEPAVVEALAELPGVAKVIRCRLGGGARVVSPDESF
jgi:diphosphomevalonate decarboxylase